MALPAASLFVHPACAAETTSHDLSIRAGTLKQSLASLAKAANVSIGSSEPIPNVRVQKLHGRMTVDEALDRLLAGLPLRARQVAPGSWRIERRPQQRSQATPSPSARSAATSPANPLASNDVYGMQEIIVTATKSGMRLSDVPGSISIVAPDIDLPGVAAPSTRDVAQAVNGMAMTDSTPGQNRVFLRGVADSPFGGPSQGTVAVIFDEARLTFDAPDPELRLYDTERIEVLKGPQGPLYGTGILGGIYRIVTHKPEFNVVAGQASGFVTHPAAGGVGGGANATINIPVSDTIAVRGTGYAEDTPGFIDSIGIGRNSNGGAIRGGRAVVRFAPGPGWTIDLSALAQSIAVDDSRYVYDESSRSRSAAIREPNSSSVEMLSVEANGLLSGHRVVLAASQVWQRTAATYDASAKAAVIGLAAPLIAQIDHRYRVANAEARIESRAGNPIGWLAGASFMQATDIGQAQATPVGAEPTLLDQPYRRNVEVAAFGNIDFPVVPAVRLALGARVFRNATDDERGTAASLTDRSARLTGFTPSASLSYAPRLGGIVFLRVANGLRPGGLAPKAPSGSVRYDSDSLTTAELGWRLPLDGSRLGFTGAAYYSVWHDVQSDYLTATGLIATRNAGDARIKGGEAALDWRPDQWWRMAFTGSYTDAQLVRGTNNIPFDDLRLPVTPEWTAAASVSRRIEFGEDRSAIIGTRLWYSGQARLSFDPGLDRAMGDFIDLSVFATAKLGRFDVALRGENLLGSKEEVFAYGNPFSIDLRQQYVVAPPLTVTLQVGLSF